MQFELSEEQSAYVASAREFAQAVSSQCSSLGRVISVSKNCPEGGGRPRLYGDVYPGRGRRARYVTLDASLIVEELARGCTTTAAF